MQIHIFILCLP